jgi:hypothetical protein
MVPLGQTRLHHPIVLPLLMATLVGSREVRPFPALEVAIHLRLIPKAGMIEPPVLVFRPA